MNICPIEQCTGCSACMNACRHSAITMRKGKNGHLFPEINADLCVGCKLCEKACPNNTLPEYNYPSATYIATSKNSDEAKTSTSAGIASVLSRQILKQGRIVYGTCGTDCQHVHHVRIDKEEDLWQIKGSKYVQSAIEDTYTHVKEDLKNGKTVLFIGTPCQVAGLQIFMKSFLAIPANANLRGNLYTVDLVCHGVPSQQILNDAIREYVPERNLSELNVSFRKKEKNKSLYGLFISDKETGADVYRSVFPKNEYIVGFLNGLYYRESCYQCHYTHPERVSDITLGDYWDRDNKVQIGNHEGGLSMVMANTNQGAKLLQEASSMLNLLDGDYSDFVKRNGQLEHPIKKHPKYEEFAQHYPQKGFLTSISSCIAADLKRIRRNNLLSKLSRIVYKIPGTKKLYKKIVRR